MNAVVGKMAVCNGVVLFSPPPIRDKTTAPLTSAASPCAPRVAGSTIRQLQTRGDRAEIRGSGGQVAGRHVCDGGAERVRESAGGGGGAGCVSVCVCRGGYQWSRRAAVIHCLTQRRRRGVDGGEGGTGVGGGDSW